MMESDLSGRCESEPAEVARRASTYTDLISDTDSCQVADHMITLISPQLVGIGLLQKSLSLDETAQAHIRYMDVDLQGSSTLHD